MLLLQWPDVTDASRTEASMLRLLLFLQREAYMRKGTLFTAGKIPAMSAS